MLRLLNTGLNGPEIARELLISLNTMRSHTHNIYGKLGVNSRRAAVRHAAKLSIAWPGPVPSRVAANQNARMPRQIAHTATTGLPGPTFQS